MIPDDIGRDPAAPNHYISFGKPADWNEADCGTLAVRRVGATGDILHEPAARIVRDDLPSGEAIYPCFMSQWILTAEERVRLHFLLSEGKEIAFRHLVCGNGLQPQSIWLKGDDEV